MIEEHRHDCNDPQCEDHHETMIPEGQEVVFSVSPEAVAAADVALGDIKHRSFSGRHPELGKMIKCQVCNRRHRQPQCTAEYKQLWMDEDVETGERTIVYATVPLHNQKPTIKAVFGAKQFKGKRKSQRPSQKGLQLVELTRALYPSLDGAFDTDEDQMKAARAIAEQVLLMRKKAAAKRIRIQQDVSRRINRGLLRSGTQVGDRKVNYGR